MMLYISLPGLPPSVNKAYFEQVVLKQMGKKSKLVPVRTLTTEGRAYKKEVVAHIVQNHGLEMHWVKPNMPLGLAIRVHFPQVENSGWPKDAQSRYKKVDATNRVKLLEDAVVQALGVDDSQFMQASVTKVPGAELTEVWVWSMENDAYVR